MTPQMRKVHLEPAPYSGPPNYETLARRFSSDPSPLAFYPTRKQEAAKERGEFVDIHDSIRPDPKNYDVLIPDMNQCTLETDIAELVGVKYIQEATKEEADQ